MSLVWTRQNWFTLNAALSGSTPLVGVSVEQLGCSCIVVVGLVCFFFCIVSCWQQRQIRSESHHTHILPVCVCLSVNGRPGNACQTGKWPHGRSKVRSDTTNQGGDVETLTFDIPLQQFFKHMVNKALYVVHAAISSYPKDSCDIPSFCFNSKNGAFESHCFLIFSCRLTLLLVIAFSHFIK